MPLRSRECPCPGGVLSSRRCPRAAWHRAARAGRRDEVRRVLSAMVAGCCCWLCHLPR